MTDSWDRANPTLDGNIAAVSAAMKKSADRRDPLTAELVKGWHRRLMTDLEPDRPSDRAALKGQNWRGKFRGEEGKLQFNVMIGSLPGVHYDDVSEQIGEFFEDASTYIKTLDDRIGDDPVGQDTDVEDVLRLAARLHAEWVRIHPFANGNGRTARLIAQFIGLRYGLRQFLPVRPRPKGEYEKASERAMRGDWEPTFEVFLAGFRDSAKSM